MGEIPADKIREIITGEKSMNTIQAAQGRWHSILESFDVPPRFLTGKHTACPLCQDGKDRFRFDDKDGSGSYFCSQCGAGDGFGFLKRLTGMEFKEVAAKVDELLPGTTKAKPVLKTDPLIVLGKIRKGIRDGNEVKQYLNGRGLHYHAALNESEYPYYDQGKKLGDFPIMVGRIVDADNNFITYHITYIKNGHKAEVPSAKKIMPIHTLAKTVSGGAVRLGEDVDHICVTEGIETALAVYEKTGMTVWAAISSGGMERLQVPDSVTHIDIYGDNDASFAGHKAAYTLAHRMAVAGVRVTVQFPKAVGSDFADDAAISATGE